MKNLLIQIAGYAVLLSGAMFVSAVGYAWYRAEPVTIQRDDTHCRAKLANWLMRYEELAKPERERWESFREYMGACVR